MSSLSKAHDLSYRLFCELEEQVKAPHGPEMEDKLNRLYEAADMLQSEIYELMESQI
jgi:hypothetical protein